MSNDFAITYPLGSVVVLISSKMENTVNCFIESNILNIYCEVYAASV